MNRVSGVNGLKQSKDPGTTVQRRIRPVITILTPDGIKTDDKLNKSYTVGQPQFIKHASSFCEFDALPSAL